MAVMCTFTVPPVRPSLAISRLLQPGDERSSICPARDRHPIALGWRRGAGGRDRRGRARRHAAIQHRARLGQQHSPELALETKPEAPAASARRTEASSSIAGYLPTPAGPGSALRKYAEQGEAVHPAASGRSSRDRRLMRPSKANARPPRADSRQPGPAPSRDALRHRLTPSA